MRFLDFFKKKSIAELKAAKDVGGLTKELLAKGGKHNMEAAQALAEVGGVAGVDAILRTIVHPDPNVRLAGAFWLGNIQDPAAFPRLMQLLHTRDLPTPVRAMACSSLGRLKNPAALDALIGELDGVDNNLKVMAAYAVCGLGGEKAAEALLRKYSDPDLALHCAIALGRMKHPRAPELMKEQFRRTRDMGSRHELVHVLGEFGGEEAGTILAEMLASGENGELRKSIQAALDTCRQRGKAPAS